ncbi:hypothetical protein QTP86_004187 [Hemibagrus guttatus]|nr:hypothetical protein QTP86_004187 [Hemibagrus guttatus]
MNLFLGVFFLVASCKLSVAIIIEYSYHHNNDYINWNHARFYCRIHYKDLATLNTSKDYQLIAEVEKPNLSGWIGLYRENVANNIWKWSDGQLPTLVNWETGWPLVSSSAAKKNCSILLNGRFKNDPCDVNHPFYCYRHLILVNESKTWEKALQYCNIIYTGLAALPFVNQVLRAKEELKLSQTDSVWTGLRFINGNWFWLNGEPIDTGNPNGTLLSLPECPAKPYCCGAFNTKTNIWENRDCNETLNFLCWITEYRHKMASLTQLLLD